MHACVVIFRYIIKQTFTLSYVVSITAMQEFNLQYKNQAIIMNETSHRITSTYNTLHLENNSALKESGIQIQNNF